VIFKDKNSEIYKKLIEIIALHSSQIGVAQPLPPDAAELKPVQNGGKESKPFQVNTIEIVIQEFSTWLNEKIGPTPQPVNETDAEAETIVGSSAPPVEAKAEVIEPLADGVMVTSDEKNTSISSPLQDAAVTSNDKIAETDAGKEKVDIKVEEQKNEQLSNVENIQTTKNPPIETNKMNGNDASVNVNTTNDSTASKNADTTITERVDKKTTTELPPINGINTSNSPIVSTTTIPPIRSSEGGNPTKNKTKKRRTKNNKRKTSKTLKNKQKRRVTKKKNRKHNHKK
jgi:hypothetical protein